MKLWRLMPSRFGFRVGHFEELIHVLARLNVHRQDASAVVVVFRCQDVFGELTVHARRHPFVSERLLILVVLADHFHFV